MNEGFVNWNRLLLIRTENGFIITEGPTPDNLELSEATVCESKSTLLRNLEKWVENE